MYDELVKRMRDSEHEIDCSLCGRDCCYQDGKVHGKCIIIEASDAIEELSVVVRAQKAVLDKFPRWIPVTERSPDMHVEVLVCTEEYGETALGFAMVAVFDGTGWLETWERKTYLTAVTHWMPLPEPPNEEK